MTKKYDCIVVGAGHNGLATAFYLAKAGKSVVVLEKQKNVGGIIAARTICEGFKYSGCAHNCDLLAPQIIKDLNLESHGLKMLQPQVTAISLLPDNKSLIMWRDPKKFVAEIGKLSQKDADKYLEFTSFLNKIATATRAFLFQTPPDLTSSNISDFLQTANLGLKLRKLGSQDMMQVMRILPMSIRDLLDEWFESEPLKALLAARALAGNALGAYSPGTASTLVYQAVLETSLGIPQGGMENLPQAMAEALRKKGVEIRLESAVSKILIEQGKTIGVKLAGGEEIHSHTVVSSTDPKQTFLNISDPQDIPPKLYHQINNTRMRGVSFKLNLALKKLPDINIEPLHGEIFIAPTIDYIEKAFDAIKYRQYSQKPIICFNIPSVLDPSLAPEGQHVMSVIAHYAPYTLKEGNWQEHKEKFTDIIINTLDEYIPNFRDCIKEYEALSPYDLRDIYSLTEGHILHGDHTLDQMFVMRPAPICPQYKTLINNLYICGAGTHPGGGITGISGMNAAQQILKNWVS